MTPGSSCVAEGQTERCVGSCVRLLASAEATGSVKLRKLNLSHRLGKVQVQNL